MDHRGGPGPRRGPAPGPRRRRDARPAGRRRHRSRPPPAGWPAGWRRASRARCWSASLRRRSPTSFCASRLGTSYDGTFGTLDGGDLRAIMERATPTVARPAAGPAPSVHPTTRETRPREHDPTRTAAVAAGVGPGTGAAHPGRHLHRDRGRAPRRAGRRQRRRRPHLRGAAGGRRRAGRRGWPRPGWRVATRSGSGSSPAPPTSTWPSSASWLAGAAYVPVDADDPDERARVVFAESDAAAVVGNDLAMVARPAGSVRGPARRRRPPRSRGRRLGHLHLGLHGHPQGRGRDAPQRGGLRRRRVAVVPPRRAHRPPRTG